MEFVDRIINHMAMCKFDLCLWPSCLDLLFLNIHTRTDRFKSEVTSEPVTRELNQVQPRNVHLTGICEYIHTGGSKSLCCLCPERRCE